MWKRQLTIAFFAWVLWVDQTAYTPPGGAQGQFVGEGAAGRQQQLGTFATKAQCEKQKVAQVKQAAARDAKAKQGGYGAQFRYLCSPTDDSAK